MDTNTRLRIATRIRFALLRHLGDSIEVEHLLHRPADTREVLWVCDASGDDELIALAAQFRHASRPEAAVEPARAASSPDNSWGRDSSGFGVSRPLELPGAPAPNPAPAPAPDRGWFRPGTWLRTR